MNQRAAADQLSRQELKRLESMKRSIEGAMNRQNKAVFEIGALLVAAKADINHGAFLAWIDEHLPFKRRTAQLYMRIAEVLSDSAELLGLFQLVTLDALAAKAIGSEARRSIIADIDSGELRTDDAVVERIAQLAPKPPGKATEIQTQRAQARTRVAQITCEIAGERINEIIDLLRAAGLADFATAIEELLTSPAQDSDAPDSNPEVSETNTASKTEISTTMEADDLPEYLQPSPA